MVGVFNRKNRRANFRKTGSLRKESLRNVKSFEM
jgi:hypothetical protein